MSDQKIKDVTFIVDKSGSMSSCREQVISGYNDFLRDLKSQSDLDIRLTLTLFDTQVTVRHEGMPVKDVPELSGSTYVPNDCTALLDAVGKSVRLLEQRWQGSEEPVILVVVMTDGFENASTEFNKDAIKKLIAELDQRPNWTFVYLGANQDSWAEAQRLGFGFSADNNRSYSPARTGQTINEVTTAARSFLRSGQKKTGDFFKDPGWAPPPTSVPPPKPPTSPANPFSQPDPTRK